ncbi:MAG: c-type cytochrome [Chloroflexi bacterium]|nr:c-type cytochrome [Chloroflexota bacterium]
MKRMLIAVPILGGMALVFLLFLMAPSVNSAPIGTAAAGKAFWGKFTSLWCLSCHGVNAEGAYGPDLAGRGLSFEQASRAIRKPWGVMPAYTTQQVSDQDIADMVAYFNSLPKVAEPGPWRTTVPAGAPLGQRLLIETAGCGQCHGDVLGSPRRAAGGEGADFAWFEELVYEHTSEFPTGRMGNFSKARLTEETLRAIWNYISQELGLRVPTATTLKATAASDGTVTYALTLKNNGIAGKGLAMGNIYISMLVPADSSVVSASTFGYQGVQRFAPTGADIAVWLAPRLAAQETLTYTLTVKGTGASAGSNAFVRWLSPTRFVTPGVAGEFIEIARVRP